MSGYVLNGFVIELVKYDRDVSNKLLHEVHCAKHDFSYIEKERGFFGTEGMCYFFSKADAEKVMYLVKPYFDDDDLQVERRALSLQERIG